MLSNFYRHQYWPTEQQQLLLRASLLEGEVVGWAYNEWIESVDIDHLDSESNMLLCLLYRNLARNQIESQHLARLKGISRYTWTKNQLIVSQFESILQELKSKDVELICFDDLAIVAHDYQDYGCKFIHSISLVIQQKHFPIARAKIEQLGWQLQGNSNEYSPNHLLFKNAQQQILSIRSSLFSVRPQKHIDKQLWLDTIDRQIGRSDTKILGNTNSFLLLCLQANQQERLSSTKVADAAMLILQRDLDWVDLVMKVQYYRAILPVRNMLSCLQSVLDLSIPDWVFSSIYTMPISDRELLDYRIPALNRGLKLKSLFLKTKKLFI